MSRFTLLPDTGVCHLPLGFELEYGEELGVAQLAYELVGPESGPVIVVLGGISAGRCVARWWPDLVGDGRVIDTVKYRVLGVDFLGGAGESTGPRHRHDGSFPVVSSRDQARAIGFLLEHLGIQTAHRFVGASYGGMVGLAFAAEHGDRLDGLITIGAAHESHPMATAWRSVQRRIVEQGLATGTEKSAVALARALAMSTYRSHAEFGQRFGSTPTGDSNGVRFPVEDYLEARGFEFAERFTAAEFTTLSRAIDLHRVDPARIRVPTLVIGITTDLLVPIEQVEELAIRLGRWGRIVRVASLYGHDGFLKEVAALAPILRDAIDGEVR